MNRSLAVLNDVLLTQRREWEQRLSERYVVRVNTRIGVSDDLVQVIIGPRRAGKSFFALHALRSEKSCAYVNFDDERLVNLENYDDLVNGLDMVYDRPRTIILDEVQNLPRWELFVNRLQRQGRRLVVTGSNSNLLSSELATHLTGRHRLIVVLPFSYPERLQLSAHALTESEKQAQLAVYVGEGGFPEPSLKPIDRGEYLRTLLQAVLYKDIVKRRRIRAVQGLEDLAHYLFSNVAKEFSFQTLTKVSRCKSVNTAEKYLRYLEETFLFFTVKRFSFKVREQAAYGKKVYCSDNGLAVAGGFRFSADTGRLYENLVAIALWRAVLCGQSELFYWKSARHEEVDFVVKKGLRIEFLMQVCLCVDDVKTYEREVRALIKAGEELRCRKLLLLTENQESTEQAEWFGMKADIQCIPLWKWLEGQL